MESQLSITLETGSASVASLFYRALRGLSLAIASQLYNTEAQSLTSIDSLHHYAFEGHLAIQDGVQYGYLVGEPVSAMRLFWRFKMKRSAHVAMMVMREKTAMALMAMVYRGLSSSRKRYGV